MTYALDSSGASSANLVTAETAAVNTQGQLSDTYLFLQQGPFYEAGLIITYTPISGAPRPLVKHVDFEPVFSMKNVVLDNDIHAAIRLINKTLVGSIAVRYQALGGSWSFLQSAILQEVSTTAIDPKVVYFALVASPPIIVPGTTAILSLSSTTALALAQSLNPSGVALTIQPMELPEQNQLDILSSGNSSDGNNSGDPPMSSNYAQEAGGNLAVIAQEVTVLAQGQSTATTAAQEAAAASTQAATASTAAATAITTAATAMGTAAAATGATTDVAYAGSGNGSQIAIEKGSYAKLADIDAKLSSGIVATGPAAAALATDASLSTLNTSVQQLVTAVKGTQAIAGSLWVDITVQPAHYYVRREVYSTTLAAYVVTWENPDGTTANPTLANLSVAGANNAGSGSNSVDQLNLTYSATATGTGFSSGDILIHSYGLDTSTSPATLSYNVWFNATTGAALTTTPSNGSFAQVGMSTVTVSSTVLAANAAQESGGNLASLAAVHGTIADTAYAGTGNSTISATLRGLYAALKGVLNIRALASGTDSVTTVPSGTQAVSGSVTVSGTVTTDGTGATGVNQLAGGAGTQGWLSGIFSKLSNSLSVTLGAALPTGANNIGSVNVAVLPALPTGTNAIGHVSVDALPAIPTGANHVGSVTIDTALPTGANVIGHVVVDSLPALPTGTNAIGHVTVDAMPALGTGTNTIGAVTAPGGGALATSTDILAVTNAIKATVGITGTVWFDPTLNPPVYYVRRESVNEGTGTITVSWLNPDGTAATPANLAKLQITGDAQSLQSENVMYTATATATGYTTNDILIHALAIDRSTSTPSVAYNFWINATAGTVLASAPAAGNISQQTANSVSVTSSALPTNAVQETGGHLAALDAVQGTAADVAYSGTGSSTVIAALKALVAKLAGTLTVGGTVTANLGTTNGLAQEAGGNLAAINTAGGAIGDTAWSGTGNGSRISILKAIWLRLTGVQFITASDGVYVPIDSLAHTYVYDGSNVLQTDAVTYGGHTYTQTYTYTSGNLTGVSNWLMS